MSRPPIGALNELKANYSRWQVGDWTDGSIFDPYAVGVFPDPSPHPQYGREAMRAYMRRFLEGWKDIRIEAESIRAIGDTFLVEVYLIGTGRESGLSTQDRAFHVWTFRGAKAIRLEFFSRESDALEAAGLSA
jgi:ketosteroid isomerase-like protein